MRWSTKDKVNLGFGSALAVFVIIGGVSYQSTTELIETERRVTHTHQVLEKLEDVLADIAGAETAQRGYLLTGQTPYLEPYYTEIKDIHQAPKDLRQLTADNPEQQQRLDRLEPLSWVRFRKLREAIDVRQAEGIEATLQVVRAGEGKKIMDDIRKVIYEMVSEERELLHQRNRRAEITARSTTLIDVSVSLLGFVMVGLASWQIKQDIAKRQQAEAALQQAHDQLEIRVKERTAELANANARLKAEIVTRRRVLESLQKSEEQFRTLVSNIPGVVYRCAYNIHRTMAFISDRIEEFSGYPASSFLSTQPAGIPQRSYASIIYPEDSETVERSLHQALEYGESYILDYRIVHADSSIYWVQEQGCGVFSKQGKLLWLDGAIFNITGHKQAEADICYALEKEKELGELKSRFVTMTSHEFRTPLATILSSTELLEHYGRKWTEEKKLIHLQRIQTAVKAMTQLLNDVLLIGRAEAGKLELNPVPLDLERFCHDLLDEVQLSTTHLHSRCPTHTIVFRSQGESTQDCIDEKLLRHILSNLLSNAIKYSPPGSAVHFNLICKPEEVVLQVRDESIGIPAVDQAQLFGSFHRASNVGTVSGTGLGLAIVKRSVDLQGGTIAVKSEVGVGTTFTVTLPLNKQVSINDKDSSD